MNVTTCKECNNKAHFLIPRRWCEYHWRLWWYKDYSVDSLERVLMEDLDCLTEDHEKAINDILNEKIKYEVNLDDINQ